MKITQPCGRVIGNKDEMTGNKYAGKQSIEPSGCVKVIVGETAELKVIYQSYRTGSQGGGCLGS